MIAIRRRTVRPLMSRNLVETLETDANGSTTPTTITFDPKVFATTQTIQLRGTPLVFNNIANHDRRRSGGWKNARTTDGSEAPRN